MGSAAKKKKKQKRVCKVNNKSWRDDMQYKHYPHLWRPDSADTPIIQYSVVNGLFQGRTTYHCHCGRCLCPGGWQRRGDLARNVISVSIWYRAFSWVALFQQPVRTSISRSVDWRASNKRVSDVWVGTLERYIYNAR